MDSVPARKPPRRYNRDGTMIADTARHTTGDGPSIHRRILGVRVDDVTWDEALDAVDEMILPGVVNVVVTPNPEIVMAARQCRELWQAVDDAALATADGVGIRWAGRLLRQPIREVVPGSDLVVGMAARAAAAGHRWFLLGAAPGVADRAGRALTERFPGLVVAGVHEGTPDPADDAETKALIAAAAPVDVLLVAYGAPGQEIWMARNAPDLDVPVVMGVGGTFNFLAGESPIPPEPVKRLGLIWMWRLVTEPWRWRRQLALLRFALLVIAEATRIRLQRTN